MSGQATEPAFETVIKVIHVLDIPVRQDGSWQEQPLIVVAITNESDAVIGYTIRFGGDTFNSLDDAVNFIKDQADQAACELTGIELDEEAAAAQDMIDSYAWNSNKSADMERP